MVKAWPPYRPPMTRTSMCARMYCTMSSLVIPAGSPKPSLFFILSSVETFLAAAFSSNISNSSIICSSLVLLIICCLMVPSLSWTVVTSVATT